jgi:hypothetical protein
MAEKVNDEIIFFIVRADCCCLISDLPAIRYSATCRYMYGSIVEAWSHRSPSPARTPQPRPNQSDVKIAKYASITQQDQFTQMQTERCPKENPSKALTVFI